VHSFRSQEQVALQQFSMPLPLAFLAGLAGRPQPGELVLEPAAGHGLLAWLAARSGSRLVLNEIDPDRAAALEEAFPGTSVTRHDAEMIDDLLSPANRPGLVLMNPPFSRSEGRGEDRYAGARHLCAAFARLAPGGRLVAIMPESFSEAGSGRDMRRRVEQQASLRLDALIARGAFARHGTGVAVRLLVLDKVESLQEPVRLQVESLDALLGPIAALAARSAACGTPEQVVRPGLSLFSRASATRTLAAPAPRSSAPAAEPLAYAILDEPAPAAEQVGIYLPYRPGRIAIPGASAHPTPLVESLAMGSIAAPRPDHVPLLPSAVVANGLLSEAQLETLIYAGSAFARDLSGRFSADE
jgi:predicted RNA methylase